MTTAAIRERLQEYIKEADDKKVEAIYTLLEDQMTLAREWSGDEEFVAELAKLKEERAKFLDQYNKELSKAEAEIDAGSFYTQDEVKKILSDRRKRIGGN